MIVKNCANRETLRPKGQSCAKYFLCDVLKFKERGVVMQNLIGKTFNELTVIEYSHKKGNKHYWSCICTCGNNATCETHNLLNGNSKTCGASIHRIENLIGNIYGRLTVVKYSHKKGAKSYWLCKCSCGNKVTIRSDCLKDGNSKSCGCLNVDAHVKHGECVTKTKLYHVYYGILTRCYKTNNKAYSHYGGRGISVCKEWLDDYENFKKWSLDNGYKEGLSIDRIDVNGDYEPQNCRWVTQKVQSNNTRRNVNITYNGETHNLTQWSKILGINRNTLNFRIKNNWELSRTFKK